MNHLHDLIAHVIVETESAISKATFDDIVAIPPLSPHWAALNAELHARGYELKFMFHAPQAVDARTHCVLEEPCAFYRVEVLPV